MQLMSLMLPCVMVTLAVGWFTLFERNMLGYMMLRKGPNKTGFMGLLQPLADGVKLFNKSCAIPVYSNSIPFIICPLFMMSAAFCLWLAYPFLSTEVIVSCGVLFYLGVSSIGVFGVLLAGWSSNSKYALLGALRAVAQSVSYEVGVSVIILSTSIVSSSLSLQQLSGFQTSFFALGFVMGPLLGGWLMCILAEANRAPFDFVEGESELVSGFNVEYSGGMFAIIYMSENSMILFNSLLTSVMYVGGSGATVSTVGCFFYLFFVWIRGSSPRMRYDALMSLAWKMVLPGSLVGCIFFFCMLFALTGKSF